ncbi:hypothetical protein [Streptomyces melanogenes]|uniref:hypothetical protein n=1 Tax=Streptomyces melanogenes TaxID=67326 RepID=UPI00379F5972
MLLPLPEKLAEGGERNRDFIERGPLVAKTGLQKYLNIVGTRAIKADRSKNRLIQLARRRHRKKVTRQGEPERLAPGFLDPDIKIKSITQGGASQNQKERFC